MLFVVNVISLLVAIITGLLSSKAYDKEEYRKETVYAVITYTSGLCYLGTGAFAVHIMYFL